MNLKNLIPLFILICLITPTLLAVEYGGVENDPELPQIEESNDDLTAVIFGAFGFIGEIIGIFGIGTVLFLVAIGIILIIIRIARNVLDV